MRVIPATTALSLLLFSRSVLGQAPAPSADSAPDDDLLFALEAAAEADADVAKAARSADATYRDDVEEEDPLNALPEGAKEVIGNEANPSLSIILDFAGAYFSAADRHRQGGHTPISNGPTIQGAELAASADIDPFFEIDMAFCMWHLHLEEIFATTTALPGNLQLRAGKFNADVGRHNPTHLHTWHFVSHPLANQFMFGAEGMALPGVELSWLFPLPWYVEVAGSLQMGEAGSFRTDFSGDPGFADFVYPLRLVQFFDLADDWALQLGLNSVLGPSQSGPESGNRTYAYGADLVMKWRPIGLGRTGYTFIAWITEGWFRQMEVAGDLWNDAGGYSDLIFGINKEWETAVRGEYWKRITGEDEDDSIDRSNYGLDAAKASASLSFMPSHFSRVRLQYSFERVDTFDDNHIVLLQLEVSAGAHGAHAY
jgi:hypothetical protein